MDKPLQQTLLDVIDRPRYLRVMEAINQISLRSESVDEILQQVLDIVLETFDCDRTFFSYPADPASETWTVPMSKDRPEWPGAAINVDYPMTEEASQMLAFMLNRKGAAVTLGDGNERPVPDLAAEHFHVRSGMNVVIYPRVGPPWVMGIQHCSTPNTYSGDERILFEAIGRRVADALTSMITLQELQWSEQRLQRMFDIAPDAIMVIEPKSKEIVYVNAQCESLFNIQRDALADVHYLDLLTDVGDTQSVERLEGYIDEAEGGELIVFDLLVRNHQGETQESEVRLVLLQGMNKLYLSIVDVSVRRKMEREQLLIASAIEQSDDTIAITDEYGIIKYVNRGFERITGYSREEAIGQSQRLLKSNKHDSQFYQRLWKTIIAGEVFTDILINRRKNGEFYYEEKTITPIFDEMGAVTHFISTGKDISEAINTEERLNYLAHHDVLTDLPNRILFVDRLEQTLYRAERRGEMVAVIFIDLDHFKQINDTLGHDFGDKVLKAVAERLQQSIRKGDVVGRLSGDEFAVALGGITKTQDVEKVAMNIIDRFNHAIVIDGDRFHVTPSIGISYFPQDGKESGELIRHADLAMYQAKEHGRNTFAFYDEQLRKQVVERRELEKGIRHALENREFYIVYQPQRDEATQQIVALEALLRWDHPERGVVLPMEFIPILEETGMINPVGEWLLESVCQQLVAWQNDKVPVRRVAVNISGRQVEQGALIAVMEGLLTRYELDPGLIEMEVTESILLENEVRSAQVLQGLSDLGINLLLDDFGTGYSSLIYLKRFPIDGLKIDQSFVMDIGDDREDELIIEGVVGMARSLGLRVIAEGVETTTQEAFLRKVGCDVMQGHMISPPVLAERVVTLMDSKQRS